MEYTVKDHALSTFRQRHLNPATVKAIKRAGKQMADGETRTLTIPPVILERNGDEVFITPNSPEWREAREIAAVCKAALYGYYEGEGEQ